MMKHQKNMIDQDEYNKQQDKFVEDTSKKGIKLLNIKFSECETKLLDTSLNINMDDAKLKINRNVKAVVKEFKPKKKSDDEPIW